MNIKDIRTSKNLTQAEVATALGVSSVVYSRYETGSRQPSIEVLIQMADTSPIHSKTSSDTLSECSGMMTSASTLLA